jgi:dTDP-4-dehydrorhamnose 3,5-epimerase
MKVRETRLAGCLELEPPIHPDGRGLFVKPFQTSAFQEVGLPVDYREIFYSRSRRGVVRGLHFQRPPQAQDKLVYCVAGAVFDVVVDLRRASPTYGKCETFALDADRWRMVFIPAGLAHGFAALTDEAVMAYAVTTEHAPDLDSGIRWDSVPVEWPVAEPVVSDRDRALEPFSTFASPFGPDA